MQIQYVIHADFELPGAIELWARERGFSQGYCRPFAGETMPAATVFDALIVMGGPQSPLVLGESPYLKGEIELIARALEGNIPVLGQDSSLLSGVRTSR